MLYHIYEMNHAAVAPFRAAAEMGLWALRHPLNPFAETVAGKTLAAALDVFETTTRRYGKPEFGLRRTEIGGESPFRSSRRSSGNVLSANWSISSASLRR